MKLMKEPAIRLANNSILKSFLISGKKHLLITGSRGVGKSTLAHELADSLGSDQSSTAQILDDKRSNNSHQPGFMPSLISTSVMRKHVTLHENLHDTESIIGCFLGSSSDSLTGNQMSPVEDGFLSVGVSFLKEVNQLDYPWVLIDELGYLESNCSDFQAVVLQAFDKKRVLAVLRKQELPFLNSLLTRDDVFIYDIDEPVLPVGCVIMASGMGKRFGSNKLMADINGKPMISNILDISGDSLFAERVVVTRHPDIEDYCKGRNISVILHNHPERNLTVRIGLTALLSEFQDSISLSSSSQNQMSLISKSSNLYGCLFAVSDQPLLTRESLEIMVLTFSQKEKEQLLRKELKATPNSTLYRLGHDEITGNPVLFPRIYFDELLTLPEQKGGNVILKKYPERILTIEAGSEKELYDIDTKQDLESLLHSNDFSLLS